MAYDNRKFVVFPYNQINNIDFSEVLESAPNTVRRSVDGTQTFVKWDEDIIPKSVLSLRSPKTIYRYDAMMQLLATPEWNPDVETETNKK